MADDDSSREHFAAVTRDCEARLAAARAALAGRLDDWSALDDIAWELVIIGSRRLHAGEFDAALAAYEEALRIQRDFAARDPYDSIVQRDISMSLDGVGHARRDAGD